MRPLMSAASEDTETSRTRALLLLGIVALSFNLRPAAVSVGPVLSEVRAGLHMSGTVAGVLTTMPVVAFALFGAAAPWLAQRVGAHRVTLLSLVAVVLGLLLRAGTGSAALFLLYSLLGLAGMATANVLLPSLVKLHFPARVGLMTSVYTTAMAIGLTTASMVTVPVASHFGADGWRAGPSPSRSKPPRSSSTRSCTSSTRTPAGFAVNVSASEATETVRPFLPLAEQLGGLFSALCETIPSEIDALLRQFNRHGALDFV